MDRRDAKVAKQIATILARETEYGGLVQAVQRIVAALPLDTVALALSNLSFREQGKEWRRICLKIRRAADL